MLISKRTQNVMDMSLGKSKTVRGVTVRKMPLGAYLRALEKLKNLPEDFISSCFPGKTMQEVLDLLSGIDQNGIMSLMASIFAGAPQYAVSFAAELTDIEADRLINDENIGVNGLMEILDAFIEVNELGEAAAAVRGLINRAKSLARTGTLVTGSKA